MRGWGPIMAPGGAWRQIAPRFSGLSEPRVRVHRLPASPGLTAVDAALVRELEGALRHGLA